MNWFTAITTGAGLGMVFFGGLWFTVQHSLRQQRPISLWMISSFLRIALMALVLYALCREGPGLMLAGLGGVWLARWCLIRGLGGMAHGR